MNMKKLASALLVCVLVFALLLTGCNAPADETDGTTTTTSTTTTASTGDDNTTASTGGDATSSTDGDATSSTDGDATSSTDGATSTGDTTTGGNNTTKPTTSSTTKGTTLSKVYTEPQLPSFERLDDGTFKDRKTGVIFIDDDCNILPETDENGKIVDNGTKVYDANKVQIDGNQKEFFGNDGARFIRAVSLDGKGCYVTYKLNSGITEVAIDAFTGNTAESSIYNGLELYVSKNGKSGWTKVDLKFNAKNDTSIGSGWTLRRYTATGIGDGYKYAKIQWKDDWSDKANNMPIYTPNVGRIRINNIDKMDETDRFLEGRVSKTFYVDNKKGNDKNDGTSEAKAWKTIDRVNQGFYQPGDKILFKSGETFTGNLKITGYGTANDRFVIGTYGGEARATLTSRGGGDVVNIACAYTTIENLDISGKQASVGLKIGASQSGAVKGVIVQNCYVHDVQTDDTSFVYSTGGIQFNATGTQPTWFDGAVIRNNIVENVSRVGIYLTGAWGDRPGAAWGASGELYKNDNDGWWPNANCSIVGNTLTRVHGDAILVISAKDTLIEKNYLNDNFTIGEDKTKLAYCNTNGFSVACATVWVCNTNGSIMQNNEVGYTHLDSGWVDGEAFDIDGANKESYIQYNYTHNNQGGAFLLCEFTESLKFTADSFHVIRFNLSIDDGWAGGHGSITAAWTRAKVSIYNNTFVQRSETWPLANIFDETHNYTFTNNIFYGEGAGKIAGNGKLVNFVMDNNVYAGGAVTPAKDGLTVKNVKNENPGFKNANFTHAKDAKANMKGAIEAFTPSKKIAGATSIKDNGGKDINGTKITDTNFYGCVKY